MLPFRVWSDISMFILTVEWKCGAEGAARSFAGRQVSGMRLCRSRSSVSGRCFASLRYRAPARVPDSSACKAPGSAWTVLMQLRSISKTGRVAPFRPPHPSSVAPNPRHAAIDPPFKVLGNFRHRNLLASPGSWARSLLHADGQETTRWWVTQWHPSRLHSQRDPIPPSSIY